MSDDGTTYAAMESAALQHQDLRGCDFEGSDLAECSFRYASLRGADFTGARLADAVGIVAPDEVEAWREAVKDATDDADEAREDLAHAEKRLEAAIAQRDALMDAIGAAIDRMPAEAASTAVELENALKTVRDAIDAGVDA